MKFYRYSLILAAVLPLLTSCGGDIGVTAADILNGSVSGNEQDVSDIPVSDNSVSMDFKPVVVLDEPVEVIRDTQIQELPFDILKVTDHGRESQITDGYYKNVLYQRMRKIADDTDMQLNLTLTIDQLYTTAKEGILVDFDYGDGTNSYIMIHDKYAYVADKNGVFLLPAADASAIERILIESETVYDAPDTTSGVDGAVKLFKDTGYTGLHPYVSVEMKPGKISTVIIKNDTAEAEFVENEPTDTDLKAEVCEMDTPDRFVDLSRLSGDDLEITIKGAEPYFRITYDTGYSVYISTGYDLTVNCDRDGNITLKDVYAGDNLIVRYDINATSYKYCSYGTFTFNGVLMEAKDTAFYLKDGIFQVFGSDIVNAALTATPDKGSVQPVKDYKGSTGGNYLYNFVPDKR